MNIPVLDLKRQYAAIKDEMDAAILDVVASTQFILGPHVKTFEEATASYCDVKHAIGVASGTDALLLSLKALDIGPGDGVILPSFTFFAAAGAVHNVGATPVFCDIDSRTFNLDPDHLRHILSTRDVRFATGEPLRLRALIPVHLYGQMADMDAIIAIADEYGLAVIEDAAQAIGAEYWRASEYVASGSSHMEPIGPDGTDEAHPQVAVRKPQATDRKPSASKAGTIGDLGCFSFYPTKNLGAYGDGGMIITNRDDLADKIRMLRVHGAKPKYSHQLVGFNSRLDAIQAAILGVKLRHLDAWTTVRGEVAGRYDDGLSGVEGLITPFRANERTHIFHQYTVRVSESERDGLREHLKSEGIGTMIYYPIPLHMQECFNYLGYREGDLPQSESASREVLSLPIFPELAKEEHHHVIECTAAFFGVR